MLNYDPTTNSVPAPRPQSSASTRNPWRLLFLSIIVFSLAAVIYAGMDFGYKPYLQGEIKKIDGKIDALSQSMNADQQKGVLDLYSQLYNIDMLSKSRVNASRIFALIEQDTDSLITLTAFDLDARSGSGKIDGIAPDFDMVVRELSSLKQDPNVEEAILVSAEKGADKDNGKVKFSIKATFAPSLFANAAAR
jgi:hypothetical protein